VASWLSTITATEQAKWLEKIIQSDEFKQAPFKVVITHIPPFGNWHGEKRNPGEVRTHVE